MLVAFVLPIINSHGQDTNYHSYPIYAGKDLGLNYSPRQSAFRIWAPTATNARLDFYNDGDNGAVVQTINMNKSEGGTWTCLLTGDHKGRFYTFSVMTGQKWSAPAALGFRNGYLLAKL